MTTNAMITNPEIDPRTPRLSREAMYLMRLLMYRSGTMRIEPLVANNFLSVDELALTIADLYERWWIDITPRGRHARQRPELPESLRDIRRITVSHTGRLRFPVTWAY